MESKSDLLEVKHLHSPRRRVNLIQRDDLGDLWFFHLWSSLHCSFKNSLSFELHYEVLRKMADIHLGIQWGSAGTYSTGWTQVNKIPSSSQEPHKQRATLPAQGQPENQGWWSPPGGAAGSARAEKASESKAVLLQRGRQGCFSTRFREGKAKETGEVTEEWGVAGSVERRPMRGRRLWEKMRDVLAGLTNGCELLKFVFQKD